MPNQGRVQTTVFPDLLNRLGINRNPFPFTLGSEIVPVALVDSSVSPPLAPAYGIADWFSGGVFVAPAIGTLFADTGPLPSGAYNIQVMASAREPARLTFEWRNEFNTGNQRVLDFPVGIDLQTVFKLRILVQTDNERFRIINDIAGGVAIEYHVQILAKI